MLFGDAIPFAIQIPPAASIAIPRAAAGYDSLAVIVIAGVGEPLAINWLGVYSTSTPVLATHMSPLASNATPYGRLIDPPVAPRTTAGAWVPLAANWLAVNSMAVLPMVFVTHRLPFASNAIAPALLMALLVKTTLGDAVPLDPSSAAEYSTMESPGDLAVHRLPFPSNAMPTPADMGTVRVVAAAADVPAASCATDISAMAPLAKLPTHKPPVPARGVYVTVAVSVSRLAVTATGLPDTVTDSAVPTIGSAVTTGVAATV